MLRTAVASLQSPDCDTEWIIGVNVVTEGFCVEMNSKNLLLLYCRHRLVHKTVNQCVSLYLKLAINTEL